MHRVVITGMSLLSPLGNDVNQAFNRLKIYENSFNYSKEFENHSKVKSRLESRVSFETPEYLGRKDLRTMDKVAQYAVFTTYNALKDANIDRNILSSGYLGVSFGSGMYSMSTGKNYVIDNYKELAPCSFCKILPQTTAANISTFFKTKGRLIPVNASCATGNLAIGFAYEQIKYGIQNIMIAGSSEEYDHYHYLGLDMLGTLSLAKINEACIPFSKNRDGFVFGEGSGTLILEELEHAKARGAKIYAEIIGFANNSDGNHFTNPCQESQENVMKLALKDANISSNDIDYVNAHATATIAGDISESNAIKNVFKRDIQISSLKSYMGHTLGACGAIETILSIKMLQNNWLAPTINLKEIDNKCVELDYIINKGRNKEVNIIMKNSFGFGGINGSLILKKYTGD